jgi:DNA polymerase-3 subunit gamma/tau
MGQALYRKYRSKNLAQIVGQEHITTTLDQALKTGRISHAYLFTGPRGVGKTSIARIMAHEINGLPYDDDSTHIDIIEIDAASNRRIDEIRELRDKVFVAPSSAKYKVYIIDEVHMLTKEAFNALLKTLEEPPAHVVFILATTDAHKLPDTIVSRTQRFTFRPVESSQVVAHLRTIADTERIVISDDALQLLAEHGEGSFRDSISLLDQAGNYGNPIGLSDVQSLLGIPPAAQIIELVTLLSAATTTPAVLISQLQQLYQQGFGAAAIAKQLSAQLRQQLIESQLQIPIVATITLLGELLQVAAAFEPNRFLELLLLRGSTVLPEPIQPITATARPKVVAPSVDTALPTANKSQKTSNQPDATSKQPTVPLVTSKTVGPPSTTAVVDESSWPQILGALKLKYNTLYGVARMAQPDFSQPGRLTLTFAFAFHQKRLNDAKNQQIITDTVEQITGQKIIIECLLDKLMTTVPIKATDSSSIKEDITVINAIFGGGEVV